VVTHHPRALAVLGFEVDRVVAESWFDVMGEAILRLIVVGVEVDRPHTARQQTHSSSFVQ
jgi:hypothetical protein